MPDDPLTAGVPADPPRATDQAGAVPAVTPPTRGVRTRRRWRRRIGVLLLVGVIGGMVTTACAVVWVHARAPGHAHHAKDVPPAPVALVLGAQEHDDATPSTFLSARLDLAIQLYRAGKVKVLLVSGDNGRPDYDEPDTMRGYLISRGIPAAKVVADYAGFDTYDSCSRARRIFGVTRAIVVTQSFHIHRAVTLCRHLGIDATGVGDTTVKHFRY